MPKRKVVKKSVRKTNPQKRSLNLSSRFRLGDSYISLFLGVLAVVLIALIGFSLMKAGGDSDKQVSSTDTKLTGMEEGRTILPEKYTVKEGDDLWSISEGIYKSGYNWVDIARENNLANPGLIYIGAQLDIPDVEPIIPEVQITPQTITTHAEGAILTDSYTVVVGDNLWEIAVRAYGDGYKWVDIARENNLENPSLIHPGTILKMSR